MVNNYFGQQGQGNFNRIGGGRGGPQGGGGFRKQFGTNGAPQHRGRPGGGNTRQHKPNRYPDSEEALTKWRGMKGLGPEVKPFTKDCPLKCSHAIPYGNASWCETFRNYEPSMKLDVIKKNNLCRRCLANWQAPHLPGECRAPPCGKCKGDHHTMICPKPTGVQVMAAAVLEEDTETIPDIYGSGGVFDDIDQQVMMVSMHEDTTRGIDE